MKKTIDKKVALKLINQYADNYKRVEKENSFLQEEISALKSHLAVNKSVIDTIFRESEVDLKIQSLIVQYNEEMISINTKNDQLTKENSNLRIKLLQYETSLNDSIAFYRESKDTLELRVFTLENSIKKKDNQLQSLNKKLATIEARNKKNHHHQANNNEANEIYVSDPNKSLTIMYGDLLLYKEGYENALVKIKETKSELTQTQKKLQSKELEKSEGNNKKVSIEMLNELISKCQRKTWETDEWLSILNYLNITKEDIDNNIPNQKFFNKLFEAIELFNKVMTQRNHQLTQAIKENENVKEVNKETMNENLRLLKHIITLKNQKGKCDPENDNRDQINNHYINNNISMINNFNLDDSNKGGATQKKELMPLICNKSFTLDNSIMNHTEPSYIKASNYTQVTENSFDIVESSNIITALHHKKGIENERGIKNDNGLVENEANINQNNRS